MPKEPRFGLLLQALAIQRRVVGALLMREVITRFGRHNIGFLWLFLEPMMFTVGVVLIWNFTHASRDLRIDVTPFVVIGYGSLLLWRSCSFRGLNAVEPNRSLLHHRQVKLLDVFIARMTLELAGVSASFLFITGAMLALELMRLPDNVLLFLAGWGLMSWFSAALGVVLGCLSERSELVERFWHPLSYFILIVSGTFFMVDWLPKDVQTWILYVPMVNAVEMMRDGYWGSALSFHYSAGYLTLVCLFLSLVALKLVDNLQRRPLA